MEQGGLGSKHGFERKFFSRNLTKPKLTKADVKLQAYEPKALNSTKMDETYMKMLKYENSVFPYSVSIFWKPSSMEAQRRKCYFNVFSPSVHRRKKNFFSRFHDKCFQNWRNPWWIVNILFCDVITKIGTCLLVTSCWNMNLVLRISNSMIRN